MQVLQEGHPVYKDNVHALQAGTVHMSIYSMLQDKNNFQVLKGLFFHSLRSITPARKELLLK